MAGAVVAGQDVPNPSVRAGEPETATDGAASNVPVCEVGAGEATTCGFAGAPSAWSSVVVSASGDRLDIEVTTGGGCEVVTGVTVERDGTTLEVGAWVEEHPEWRCPLDVLRFRAVTAQLRHPVGEAEIVDAYLAQPIAEETWTLAAVVDLNSADQDGRATVQVRLRLSLCASDDVGRVVVYADRVLVSAFQLTDPRAACTATIGPLQLGVQEELGDRPIEVVEPDGSHRVVRYCEGDAVEVVTTYYERLAAHDRAGAEACRSPERLAVEQAQGTIDGIDDLVSLTGFTVASGPSPAAWGSQDGYTDVQQLYVEYDAEYTGQYEAFSGPAGMFVYVGHPPFEESWRIIGIGTGP